MLEYASLWHCGQVGGTHQARISARGGKRQWCVRFWSCSKWGELCASKNWTNVVANATGSAKWASYVRWFPVLGSYRLELELGHLDTWKSIAQGMASAANQLAAIGQQVNSQIEGQQAQTSPPVDPPLPSPFDQYDGPLAPSDREAQTPGWSARSRSLTPARSASTERRPSSQQPWDVPRPYNRATDGTPRGRV